MAIQFPIIKTGDSTFDKIYAYYKDPSKYPLTKKQTELKERWLAAFALRQNFHSREQASNVLMEKYDISRAQAYRDLKDAERLFGNIMKADRDGSLAILYEYSHKYLLMAVKAKDLKAIGKALELMGRYSEIDRETAINFNPEKLEDKPIKVSVPKEVSQAIVKALSKGTVDFNDFAIDVEHEEVEDE
ncbi:hypothetical protein [Leptobacterium sp. I13]|uniref:hypothetical protein n=1 Tax=Leptobacterium meishanense TaxID=3128904 RepID=UPI0030EF8636